MKIYKQLLMINRYCETHEILRWHLCFSIFFLCFSMLFILDHCVFWSPSYSWLCELFQDFVSFFMTLWVFSGLPSRSNKKPSRSYKTPSISYKELSIPWSLISSVQLFWNSLTHRRGRFNQYPSHCILLCPLKITESVP